MATIFITGASKGLGLALAKRLCKEGGHKLVLGYYNTPPEKTLGKWIRGDISEATTRKKFMEVAEERGVDVLINNASIYQKGNIYETPAFVIQKLLGINLVATMMLTQSLWPYLKESTGKIININSLAGLEGGEGELAYCASKFGLRGFSEALQYDAVRDGVGVIDLMIGAMRTGMTKHRPDWDRLINPEEVASYICSLCTMQHRSMRITEVRIERAKY